METKTIMLEADYLVIGAGASGMAFADELIHNTSDVTLIMVDKHAKPGGHWNDAYDFVRLHQPAAYYGVNSKQLGEGGEDLVSFSQINAYYELVMKELLASGRMKFFPQCEYKGNCAFQSMMERGLQYKVKVLKKTVDATYVGPTVPSVRKPEFGISDGVNLVPVNGLSHNQSSWKRYVIIGGGKTGIDAVLFLLDQSVNPDHITWVIPNDYWLFNRNGLFPNNWCNTVIQASSYILEGGHHEELFKKWESAGIVFRLDTNVEPTRMKSGTVTQEELEHLRLIKDIIRKGRIERIEPTCIIFQEGSEVDTDEDTLHVDCSANGLSVFIPQKIFNGTKIILQDVKLTQSAYSASVVAAFESLYPDDEEKKNEVLKPVSHPQSPSEFIICWQNDLHNEGAIGNLLGISWFRKIRLHPMHHLSFFDFLRLMIYGKSNGIKLAEALEKMVASIENGK